MPCKFYHCGTCDAVFVGGKVPASQSLCVSGRCSLKEVSEEEAERIAIHEREEN